MYVIKDQFKKRNGFKQIMFTIKIILAYLRDSSEQRQKSYWNFKGEQRGVHLVDKSTSYF